MALLEADDIQLKFGTRNILSDIYIKCETGSITGLLGRNGAGKSCLMKIIFGCQHCENKSVRVDGAFINSPFRQKQLITMLPQSFFTPPSLSVPSLFRDFALEFDEFSSMFPELNHVRKMKMKQLSGGQRRLIETYSIIKSKTKFSLLDEPFTHLMPLHVEKLIRLLHSEKKKKGFLISDHLFRLVVAETDYLYLLKDGHTHIINNPSELSQLGYVNDSRV